MTIKRVGGLKQTKTRRCLKCGAQLFGLKDNVKNECQCCGQKHFVDIYGDTLVLTVAERPDIRRRRKKKKGKTQPDQKQIEEWQRKLAVFRAKCSKGEL